jgi:hydrogenase-4 component E
VSHFAFDVAHMLAGLIVLGSLTMLYQDRLTALINVLAGQSLLLAA